MQHPATSQPLPAHPKHGANFHDRAYFKSIQSTCYAIATAQSVTNRLQVVLMRSANPRSY